MLIELPIGRRIVDERAVIDTALFNTDLIVSVSVDYDNAIWEYGADPRSSGLCKLVYNGPAGPETHTIYLSLEEVMDAMEDREPLEILINTHGGPMPEKHGAFYDLATTEDVSLRAGDFRFISLGISIEVPKGYYTEVVPRASAFMRYGLLTASDIGIFDWECCKDGDILQIPAFATESVDIPKGTRIAQMTFRRELPSVLTPVSSLDNPDRGGFGSTGR